MLNLLPDSQKRLQATHLLYEQVRQVSLTVLSIGLVLTGAMITTDRLLQMWYTNLSQEATINVSETDRVALEELVRTISAASKSVVEINNQFRQPLQIAQLVLQNTPNETIQLNRIQFSYIDGKLSLQGIAKDRAALVGYQQTVENITGFSDVNFPLNDFNQRDQINFTAYATISNETTTN